ncbi:MAG: sigma-70 family RNA polymerase sigma factor [Candidatus Marinimicrobia bacterium]|nr:sigma-70 family RNA polymerase sigma factor [Candidatus Neomarinimicrobiota bacterium]
MQKDTDILLFEKVQDRDPQAFDQIVREYSPGLNSFILRMVSNVEDAQDILQDTFVKVWEKSHQFKGRSSLKTWIYRIAINLCYSHLKRRQRWSYTFMEDMKVLISGSDPVKETEYRFHSEILGKSLAILTPRQRAVVIARIYEDLPYAQISDAVGCSVNAAKVHFHEGKKRIEAFMKAQVGENG